MTFIKNTGEVSAISGYDFQFEIFATELYNCLLNHELEWVEFASSSTGKLDDVLIGVSNRILAYQIKEISSSKFSYSQFTVSDTESILQGAFKGWKSLREKYPNLLIDARFISTQSVSEHDTIIAFKGNPKPSFAKFIKGFWLPIQNEKYDIESVPASWMPVLLELSNSVGAKPQEFIEFIRNFTFVFDFKLNYYLYDTYTQTKRDTDIERITKNIFRLVAKKGNVRYNRTQFISEFGLKNKFEPHFQHSFFIDEKHYQPNLETSITLERIINRKKSGYIALVGNAGSGKSTLLTKWLSEKDYKVLKYYAYTNSDMNYEFGFRGEATYFLHDLLVQIRESRLNLQDRLPENDLLDLQKHFHEELQKLKYLNRKVIIIVDGLDHIEREQKVNKSLIEVLPKPGAVPENVYLILGSRTIEQLENLSFDIYDELRETDSIVTISLLSKEHILRLIESYGIHLPSNIFEVLCSNTKGHPLFLRYTLEELRSAEETQYEYIINKNKFSGDIYKEYLKFWNNYRDHDEFVHTLGLISRFRYPYFDTELLRNFKIKGADASRINKLSESYFYKSDNIWQFFHNSFKEFLIDQSAKDRFSGRFDKQLDREYHLEIANAIRDTDNEYRFNELYHLVKAEKHKEVTLLATQDYFRQQWFACRDSSIILEDIKLASLSSFYQKDQNCLAACFFSAFELEQRTRNFPINDHYTTFLQIDRPDIANSLVSNNARLLVDDVSALKYSKLLYQHGQKELAKELFERATPFKLIYNKSLLNTRRYNESDYTENDEVEIVCTWAVTATFFLPLEDIVERLQSFEVENEEYDGNKRDPLSEGLADIASTYIELKDWKMLAKIADTYDAKLDSYTCFYFYFDLINAVQEGNYLYQRCIVFFDSWNVDNNNSINIRYLIVYTILKLDIERCRPVLAIIKPPSDFKDEVGINSRNSFSNYIFNYSRLFYIISKDFEILPETLLPLNQNLALSTFYNIFAELGKSYAWIFYDYKDASKGFYRSIDRVFDLFHYSYLDPLHEHSISSNKSELVNLILRVSSKISSELISNVLEKVSSEWEKNNRFWTSAQIQQVIEWIIDTKLNHYWCFNELEILDTNIFETGYLDQRLNDGVKQVELWSKLGEQKRSEALLELLMSLAFDVRGEKDYQLDYLVQWIPKFQPIDHQEVQFYFDRLLSIDDKVNSPSHTPAGELLRLSLGLGNEFNVFKFLLFEGLVEFIDGLESVFAYLFNSFEPMRIVSLKLFTRILLSLDNSHGNRRHFIFELFKLNPSIEEISTLVIDVNVYAILEVRNDYLYDIYKHTLSLGIDPKSVGLPGHMEESRNSGSSENILRLKSGESFTEKDLLGQINNLQDIISLEKEAEQYSYFKWNELIKKVIPLTSDGDLDSYLSAKDIDSVQLSEIGGALIDNGRVGLANKVLEQALAKSTPSGWVTIYDGGSKLKIYEQLKRIKSDSWFKEKAFMDFSQSIGKIDINAMEILTKDLDKIFELFSDQANKLEIYDQIIAFRNELLRNHKLNEQQISVIGDANDLNFSVEILYFLITFPSNLCEIIYPILIQEQVNLREVIDKILSKLYDDGFSQKFVHLLAGLTCSDTFHFNHHKKKLIALLKDKRFDISRFAFRILNSRGYKNEDFSVNKKKDIPLSYTIELSPSYGIVNAKQEYVNYIDELGFLKDTQDPLVYTQLFTHEIEYLAQITNFKPYNIAYRIMVLGQDPQFPEWCSNLRESSLREIYESRFRLKIAYNRPQIQKVISGLMQVVNELLELNLINEKVAEILTSPIDERLYFIEIKKRPAYIGSILSKHGSAPSTDVEWAKDISSKYLKEILKIYDEDQFILAEYTTLSAMGHGSAIEIRQSFIDVFKETDSSKWAIYNRVHDTRIDEYPFLEQSGFCLYNFMYTTDPRGTWLAINPLLAMELGLRLNKNEGNFRWDDENGQKVVESIFWQDGNVANKSSHHNSEAGHGWVVVITREGFNKLLEILNARRIFHHRKVERNMEFIQRRYNTYIDEKESKYESVGLDLKSYI